MEKFIIENNNFLSKQIQGFYSLPYYGFNKPDNPNFINDIKNTFGRENIAVLSDAFYKLKDVLYKDLKSIIKTYTTNSPIYVLCVPRSKRLNSYKKDQLYFLAAVNIVVNELNKQGYRCAFIGNALIRVKDTRTTHIRCDVNRFGEKIYNEGPSPYVGITNDTCNINKLEIENRNILLIDDIYTKTVNIDEDCIQALLDAGAKNVLFYSVGYTKRNELF